MRLGIRNKVGGEQAPSAAAGRIIRVKTVREVTPLRLKAPPQPLVFCFQDATGLCAAVQALYRLRPQLGAGLSFSGGRYYLCVEAPLRDRQLVRGAAPACCLGAAPVLYAYRREHGMELSRNAIKELGRPLAG